MLPKVVCAIAVLLASMSNSVFANTLPDVTNARAEGSSIVWDPLPGAAGYNIYSGALVGSQQGQGGLQYVTTITNATSFQPVEASRVYVIVAFSEGGAAFSDISTAPSAFISAAAPVSTDLTDVTFYNDSIGRYLVQTICSDTSSECTARCDHNGNSGNATGGFCATSAQVGISSYGTQRTYQCSTANGSASTMTAGVYCAP